MITFTDKNDVQSFIDKYEYESSANKIDPFYGRGFRIRILVTSF